MSEERLKRIEQELDLLLETKRHQITKKKYITARDVEDLTGLN